MHQIIILLIAVMTVGACATATSDGSSSNHTAEAAASADLSARQPLAHFEQELPPGSKLKIYYQYQSWEELAHWVAELVEASHIHYLRIFHDVPAFTVTVALVDKAAFRLKTESPDWINAVFHKGRIFIPLNRDETLDQDRLISALRHEYAHALIYAMSHGRCPGWMDEGLARWAEGIEHPTDRHLMSHWMLVRRPLPLAQLSKGFVGLGKEKAKVAYAQSLYAVTLLVDTYGLQAFSQYFTQLRAGVTHRTAFYKSFGVSEATFEKRLHIHLRRWAVKVRRVE